MKKIFFLCALCASVLAVNATEGALPGAFTINAQGDQVHFSKGNLQYQASTQTWRFAENQYDYVGDDNYGLVREGIMKSDNSRISDTYSGWIDLFGYATGNNPTVYNTDYDYSAGIDWGYNAISNGGNMPELWRCLTISEWSYIIYSRNSAVDLKTKATVNGVKGAILLPDGWSSAPDDITMTLTLTDWTTNSYTKAQWEKLEAAGAVFFPAGGERWKQEVTHAGESAGYWALGYDNKYHTATIILTDNSHFKTLINSRNPAEGYAVRLVQPAEKPIDVHPVPPAKALTGRFSVAADKQVIFAQGNLQYKASDNKWAFSDKQYDMIGADNANISASYKGWIDLFGWGTSGYNSKYPYMTSDRENQYGDGANDIAGTYYDWGVFATIANGNDEAWRTLTKAEWEYLLQTRTNAADKWGNATVADVPGLIILPDAWTTPAGLSFAAQQPDWTTNTYSADQWTQLENAGAIFLPAAARRDGTTIMSIDADVRRGYYWTSTANGNGSAYAVRFMEDDPASLINDLRLYGYAVRLARDKKATEGIESPSLQGRSGEASKVLRNGVLLIKKNGKTYNVLGTRVKLK